MSNDFKPIPGFENYGASDCGRIFSYKSNIFLKTNRRINNSGYESVCLYRGARPIAKGVHWCVLMAFDPRTDKRHVNHINGNKRDNRLENLEWVSRSENMKHAYDLKLAIPWDRRGSKNPRSKLTPQMHRELKQLRSEGWTYKKLASKYGMYPESIGKALQRPI